MSRIYIYPKLDRSKLISPNPYVDNLEASFARHHTIVNNKPNATGVADLFAYFTRTDAYLLNWIEDLPQKRFGILQSMALILFLWSARLFRKKIIWVLHNKHSHKPKNKKWTSFLHSMMIKQADFILTHSGAGVEYVEEKFPKQVKKVHYVVHPIDKLSATNQRSQIAYDFLIWGTIYPYKGILEFLDYASKNQTQIKILIVGVCPDDDLYQKLSAYFSENIVHISKYLSMDELSHLAAQSKYILFTYNSDSVLSSGSLMDSIAMGACIIGPKKGAFKDLEENSFIDTYSDYDEIFKIIDKPALDNNIIRTDIENFCFENSWEKFYNKIEKDIELMFE
jgi:beta-1,4-mannosyltransferase